MKTCMSWCLALAMLANVAVAQQREQREEEPAARRGQQTDQTELQPAEPTAVRRGAQTDASVNPLDHYLAACLIIANEKEIAASQAAMQKVQDEQVKQFAQKMIEEHEQFIAKLKQIVPHEVTTDLQFTSAPAQPLEGNGLDQNRAIRPRDGQEERQPQDRPQQDRPQQERPQQDRPQERLQQEREPQLPGQQERTRQGAEAREFEQRTQQADQPTSQRAAQQTRRPARPGQQDDAEQHVAAFIITRGAPMHELLMIDREAAQHALALAQQQMSRASEGEIDQVYMGMQVCEHVAMLSKLRAMDGKVSPELQTLISQAEKSTQQHLQMATQLVDTLSSGGQQQPRTNE